MRILAEHPMTGGGRMQLCFGDLTGLGADDAVDLLVVSAFPGNYNPVRGTLIGGLARRGLSVAELARSKATDARAASACWLSEPIPDGKSRFGFGRVLCYEPPRPDLASVTVGDVFRCLVFAVLAPFEARTIAMPILAGGSQRRPLSEMLPAMLDAAVSWTDAHLPIDVLRIVVNRDADEATRVWERWAASAAPSNPPSSATTSSDVFDVFVSYARRDSAGAAAQLVSDLRATDPSCKVFVDTEFTPGRSWQQGVYDSLNRCKKVAVLISPGFLASAMCQEELNIARLRDRQVGNILFPLYVHSIDLADNAHIAVLQYEDCREADPDRLRRASRALARSLA